MGKDYKDSLICEICDTKVGVKIARRFVSKFGILDSIDRKLCKDCMKFTESYLKTISEQIDGET